MKFTGTPRIIFFLVILVLNIIADQATKSMMRAHIGYYDQYFFFNNHVTLLRVENTGAFLSLGAKLVQPFRFILITLLPAIALLGALFYSITKKGLGNLMVTGIVFCIGGGMGNLYDRIVRGSVTDFVHLKFGPLQTGIFNAADVSIMIGFGLILLNAFLRRNDDQKAENTVIEDHSVEL
ncbi:signal peptidase II [Mucilaginibacter sp. AK015]|uniref:signal peptidase II n=1 Tax=Mucilaginibacter sp. AK015 TaxID=2723072 RepID=UPI00161A5A13|nr:signal peptidase II [Mucilaginibacter sp. AK015]MBB5397508.1 signal peptidase II [Mucilaginibacter sp. AK015]